MAWVKIPKEHHPIFRAAVPRGATTKNMFGGIAAFVNDNMFGGLFAKSIIVKLSEADQKEALALDGTVPFDPMGNGRVMTSTLLLPDSVMDDELEMRTWLLRAHDYVATLPPKNRAKAKTKTKPVAKASAKAKAKAPAKAKPAAKKQKKR